MHVIDFIAVIHNVLIATLSDFHRFLGRGKAYSMYDVSWSKSEGIGSHLKDISA